MILVALSGGMFVNAGHAPQIQPIHVDRKGNTVGGLCFLCGRVEPNVRHHGHRSANCCSAVPEGSA